MKAQEGESSKFPALLRLLLPHCHPHQRHAGARESEKPKPSWVISLVIKQTNFPLVLMLHPKQHIGAD